MPRTARSGGPGPLRSFLTSTFAAMLAIVLIVTGGAAFYALSTPDEYTGRALVQFRPRATKNGGIVGNESAASATAGYAAYLGAPSTVQAVAAQIGVQPSMLRDGLAIQVLPATTTLSVSFTSGAADLSAQGANALAQVAMVRATDDPVVSATVLAPAGVPGSPSGPQRALIVVAGFFLGLLLAATAYLFGKAMRRSRAPQPAPALPPTSSGPPPRGSVPDAQLQPQPQRTTRPDPQDGDLARGDTHERAQASVVVDGVPRA